jgi:hypothetical protein
LFAPVEELTDGNGIGHPGVSIADVRREFNPFPFIGYSVTVGSTGGGPLR